MASGETLKEHGAEKNEESGRKSVTVTRVPLARVESHPVTPWCLQGHYQMKMG